MALGSLQPLGKKTMQKTAYPNDIDLVRKIYKLFTFGLPVLFIFRIELGFEFELFVTFIITYCFIFFAYWGLTKIKSWVVTLILINSIWGILNTLTHCFQGASDNISLATNIIFGSLSVLFYGYSFMVFSKRRTKEFFGDKGKTII